MAKIQVSMSGLDLSFMQDKPKAEAPKAAKPKEAKERK